MNWQRYQGVPWILFADRGNGSYLMADERTGEQFWGDANDVNQFAADRSARQGYMGMGDLVAQIAKPIAGALGMQQNCQPCAARQMAMNQAFPALFRR